METGGEPALYDQPGPHRLSPSRFTETLKGKTHLLLSFCWILADSVFFPGFSATVLGDDSGSATATEGFTTSFSSFGCSGTELALSLSVNKPFKKNKYWAFRSNDNLQSTWLALCTKNTYNATHHVFRHLDWPSCSRHEKKKGMLKFLGDFPWFCCSWCQAMCAAAVKMVEEDWEAVAGDQSAVAMGSEAAGRATTSGQGLSRSAGQTGWLLPWARANSTGMTALLFMINSRTPKDPTAVNSGVSGNGGTFEAERDMHVRNKSYSWNPTLSCIHIIISSSAQFAPSPQPPHKFPLCAPWQDSAEKGVPLEMMETHPQILPHHHWVTLTMPLWVFSTWALV